MTRTWTKICGLTRVQDAEHAVSLGARAVGVVMVPGTPRWISPSQAREVLAVVDEGSGVRRVGLFMNAPASEVVQCLKHVKVDWLQFHGDERPEFCASFGLPYLKAFRLEQTRDMGWSIAWEGARACIVDSHVAGGSGGSGQAFDWHQFPGDSVRPLILAGGLTPDNVADGIKLCGPWGVDVSSGVESAPGIKDHRRLERFFQEVDRADEGR